MDFEWDAEKNAANIQEHGIDFEDAKVAFDRAALEKIDGRRNYGEERWIRLGWMDDIPICMVFTRRPGVVRFISARLAEKAEEEELVSQVEGEKLIQQGKWKQKNLVRKKKKRKLKRIELKIDRQER